MRATAVARVLDDGDESRWAELADAALALAAVDGARVLGHLERRERATFARAADGALLGWSDAAGTYDARGRRLRFETDAEWLLTRVQRDACRP